MSDNEQVIIYQGDGGDKSIEVKIVNETIWLSLNQIAELFDRDKSVISRHISGIFKDEELERNATVAKNAIVQTEGGRTIKREIEVFNLDVIISVGYRVGSKPGTQFRIWANKVLKEYLTKGFAINQDRLKETESQLKSLKGVIRILERTINEKTLRIQNSREAHHPT